MLMIRSGEVSHGSELLVKWCEMLHGLIEGDSESEEEADGSYGDDDDDDVTLKASERCSYRGVRKQKNKWSMRITVNGVAMCKYFDTEIEAAKEYDRLVCKMIA
jgi:hypothetical protein